MGTSHKAKEFAEKIWKLAKFPNKCFNFRVTVGNIKAKK